MTPECIAVRLAQNSYNAWISHHCLSKIGGRIRQLPELKQVQEAMVLTSPTIGALYFADLARALKRAGFSRVHRHDIPDGEHNKSFEQYGRCLDALAKTFKTPEALPLVINLGGGVVSDLGGFAAATFRRGVPYVQVPTTLLACVDSAVGGKVDINFKGYKNLVGQFYQPKLVFADLRMLETLDPRQVRSGVAEIIKYGTVCSRKLFEYLENQIEDLIALKPEVLIRVTTECYRIKAGVVSRDERDTQGIRIVLNFGHTLGHAIESESAFKLTHGEAVAVGMVAATQLAVKLGICAETVGARLRALLRRAGLPTDAKRLGLKADHILARMKHDKKFVKGRNLFVLPTAIGAWRKREGIAENVIRKVALADLI